MVNTKCMVFIKFILILIWLTFLQKSDAYYVPYLFIALVGMACLVVNYINGYNFESKKEKRITVLFACLFTLMVTLSNYGILSGIAFREYMGNVFRILYKIVLLCMATWGGISYSLKSLQLCMNYQKISG